MLKHYQMYLNTEDPDDLALIKILDRYVRNRRVGEFLRAASMAYMKQHSVAASAFATVPASAFHSPVDAALAGALPSAAGQSVVEKARKAFFK